MTPEKELSALHALLAQTLARAIKDGVKGEDGEPVVAPASLLNVARQFLKDNNITSDFKTDQNLQSLTQTVPFTETDEYGVIE